MGRGSSKSCALPRIVRGSGGPTRCVLSGPPGRSLRPGACGVARLRQGRRVVAGCRGFHNPAPAQPRGAPELPFMTLIRFLPSTRHMRRRVAWSTRRISWGPEVRVETGAAKAAHACGRGNTPEVQPGPPREGHMWSPGTDPPREACHLPDAHWASSPLYPSTAESSHTDLHGSRSEIGFDRRAWCAESCAKTSNCKREELARTSQIGGSGCARRTTRRLSHGL